MAGTCVGLLRLAGVWGRYSRWLQDVILLSLVWLTSGHVGRGQAAEEAKKRADILEEQSRPARETVPSPRNPATLPPWLLLLAMCASCLLSSASCWMLLFSCLAAAPRLVTRRPPHVFWAASVASNAAWYQHCSDEVAGGVVHLGRSTCHAISGRGD